MATLDVEQTRQPGSLANARLPGQPDKDHLLISFTRLQLASPRFLGGFMWLVVRSGWQARRAPGCRDARMLAEGFPSRATHSSAQQAAQAWPPPRLRPLAELVVQPKR